MFRCRKWEALRPPGASGNIEKTTGSHIPIIAMTAHALKGDRERCLEAGMDAYVPKPVESRVLFEAIDSMVPARTESRSRSCSPNRGAAR